MIDYDQIQFATAPRTGTAWMIDAFQLCGFGPGFSMYAQIPFSLRQTDKLRLSVIRHPIDWLSSCYSTFRHCDTNVVTILEFMDLPFWKPFDSFLRAYLESCPGAVSRLFDRFKADTYIRLEDLPDAFLELTESLGVPKCYSEKVKLLRARNCSDYIQQPRGHLRQQVMDAERSFCDNFNYW